MLITTVVSKRIAARNRRWTGAVVFVALASALVLYTRGGPPERFAAVVPGRLYRCGAVSPKQLERLVQEHRIGRVLCLLNPEAPEVQAERAAAERLGLLWDNLPLPGDGASTPAQRERLRTLVLADQTPTLVHCAAGSNRTGLAVGIYRLHHDGWTLEQALDEMRRFGFKDKSHHENLRQALAAEAALAAENRLQVSAGENAAAPGAALSPIAPTQPASAEPTGALPKLANPETP